MPKVDIREIDRTTNPIITSTTNDILVVKSGILQEGEAPKLINREQAKGNVFLETVLTYGGRVVIANTWKDAIDYCGDRNQYDIKFILAKEGVTESIEEQAKSELECALEIAQKRKDSVVVYTKINPSYNEVERPLLSQPCNYIAENAFYNVEEKKPVGKYVLAFYAPKGEKGLHSSTDDSVTLDAGQGYILAYLNNVFQGRPDYFAVAGATRGGIPGYVVDGFVKESDIDNMQLRTYGGEEEKPVIAINPIVNMNPFGTRIWGNRTCLPNNQVEDSVDSVTDQLVASSFANIRIATCDIKKALYRAARRCQFEQNTDVLWVNFTSQVNVLLEQMKSSAGIVGYRWTRNTAEELRGEVRATLKVIPIEGVEDFPLTVELNDSLEGNIQVAE